MVEKHSVPGGNLTGWDREGYHIDNCIHWLTGTNPVMDGYAMWKELGALGNVGIYRADALYSYEKGGQRVSLLRDLEKLREELLALSPEDRRETEALIRAVGAMKAVNGVSGVDNSRRSTAAERARALPALLKYLPMTCGDLAKRFKSPVICGFFESLLTESFGAIGILSVLATFCADDGDLPVGASLAMARRMAARFTGLGGKLRCGTGVRKIKISGGRAESAVLDDGRILRADSFILAADPASAFGGLLDPGLMPKALSRRYENRKLRRFSSCHCAFACELSSLPFKGNLILELSEELKAELGARNLILRECSHEKGFAPSGKSVLQTMFFCSEGASHSIIALSEKPGEYEAFKLGIARKTEDFICRRFPELSGKLRLLDVWTPATYKRYTGAEMGSYMSFAFSSGIVPTFLSGRVRGVKNLFLATQWQQAPGGLPIAAKAGRAAAEAAARIKA